jgi:predicted GTPase
MPNAVGQDNRETAKRVYGVLATSLNEALGETRQALEPHAGLLPEGRLAELDELLAEFARRRVRIAVYGEVKAGKSTLINAIAGNELSPSAFDPLTSLPVRITYGSRTAWRVDGRTYDSVEELARVMREGTGDRREVVVETDLDLLQLGGQVDLLDTPGVGAEQRFDEISAATLSSLDAVVLVVRYPALFTQFTRDLMEDLDNDIGKLFVVWNLDADCAELDAEERDRHAETLRRNVSGAHELFLVDARAALGAARQEDAAALEASGIAAFTRALGDFASSDKREVASLREAAKRAQQRLDEALRLLSERRTKLEAVLAEVRERLKKVRDASDARTEAARAKFSQFENTIARIGDERAAQAVVLAGRLARELRAARRRWVRGGDLAALESAVAPATGSYADRVDEAHRSTLEAVREAAREFGTTIAAAPRPRREPSASPVAPQDRIERALTGRVRLLRRALWRRWYLPGLTALERSGVSEDLASQSEWFATTAQAAHDAARRVLEGRLADIARRADAEAQKIKTDTRFDAAQGEFDGLVRHIPIVAAKREAVVEINGEARALMS